MNPADLVTLILQNVAESLRVVGGPEDCGFRIDNEGKLELTLCWTALE